MAKRTVVFLHGFASSGKTKKAHYLREKFESVPDVDFVVLDFNPTRTDFEYLTVTGMIARLRQLVLDRDPEELLLVGSSLGALVALRYAERYGAERLLLLAPLLNYQSLGMSEDVLQWWKRKGEIKIDHYSFAGKIPLRYAFHQDGLQYADLIEPPAPTLIVHGREDERISIEQSRAYVGDYSDRVELVEVDSGHRLNDQLDLIWEQVQSFLLT